MKKAIAIIIFGLLLSGCGTQIAVKNYEDFRQQSIELGYSFTARAQRPSWVTAEGLGETDIIQGYNGDKHSQETANIRALKNCGYSDCVVTMKGSKITPEGERLINEAKLAKQQIEEEKKEEEKKEEVKVTSMIDDAKDKCKVIGFEEGTEKFTDCTLKLYSQSVELAAKQNQQVVIQGQSSGSNVMTIYDPVRDNNALIKRGMGLINGTCTLGDLSNC